MGVVVVFLFFFLCDFNGKSCGIKPAGDDKSKKKAPPYQAMQFATAKSSTRFDAKMRNTPDRKPLVSPDDFTNPKIVLQSSTDTARRTCELKNA